MEFAVGALSGMVDALPGKLGELLQQEYAVLAGVRGDVTFFQSELGTMHAALVRCESIDEPDAQTRNWVGKVRELAYDIEDWVDLFAHRVDAAAATADADEGTFSRFTRWIRYRVDKVATIPARHVIATELQDLKQRVLELSEQRKRYRFDPPAGISGSRRAAGVDPRLLALYDDASSLVGLSTPVEELSKMVVDAGEAELKVVSIVGMAGSGKTALAAAIHRHLGGGHFDCRAFVPVGQKPDIAGKTLKGILSQVSSEHGGGLDIGQLIARLRETLKNRRYLIVIDDLWSRTDWSTIRCCFPDDNLGSRIIITTRNDAVAKDCSSHSSECIYNMKLLSDDDSMILFERKASAKGDTSAKIMRKCGGLPLAVVTAVHMFAERPLSYDWESIGWNMLFSSHQEVSKMKQILDLSYNELPSHLKPCLLYLSIFPDDHDIDIERLERRWIAEGFIRGGRRGTSPEETARSYLDELIARNMVQPLPLNNDGTGSPKKCRVHPVIHGFIVVKSMEENFVTLVDVHTKDMPTSLGTVRHLSLQNTAKQDQALNSGQKDQALNHARSVTVFGRAIATPRLTELSVLRVLDLEGCQGRVSLDGLCKLVLLRYLSLRGTDVRDLPAQIGELRCLGTLDVRSTEVKELPPSLVRLENLTHLLVGNAKLPRGIRKMKALLTLSCAGFSKSFASDMQELGEIGNMRELELFLDATHISGDKKQATFPCDGFQRLKQLCVHCSFPSVAFETSALPNVEVLELKFDKGYPEGSSGVSGVEHLRSLKHLIVGFSQNDAEAAATIAAVRTATEAHRNCPKFTNL